MASTLPLSASRIVRLGSRSSWAGQCAIQPPPAFCPTRALARGAPPTFIENRRAIRCWPVVSKSRLGGATQPGLFGNPPLQVFKEVEHPPTLYEAGSGAARTHDGQRLRAQPEKPRCILSIQAAIRVDHNPNHFDFNFHCESPERIRKNGMTLNYAYCNRPQNGYKHLCS